MSEVLTPKAIETKDGTNSKGKPWTLFRVEFADGTKASTFDAKIAQFVRDNFGRPVNIEISKTEKGKDLVSAWPLDGAQPAVKQHISVDKKSSDDFLRPRNPGESRIIARQAALKAAANVYSGSGSDPRAVLAAADEFVEWVFREDVGVRHIAAATPADAEKEREAIRNDVPADENVKALVVSQLLSATPDAKAVLHNYGLATVGDIHKRLTRHVADLFFEANHTSEVPF